MQKPFESEGRLKILQNVDKLRRWYSLDDKRLCAICDQVIDGHEIEIRGEPENYTLHCPTDGCPANFSHWFLYHAPVVGGTDAESLREQTDTAPSKVQTGTVEMSFFSWADR